MGGPIPAETRQLVVGVVPGWDATTATLQVWERDAADAPWRAAGEPWPATVGASGIAWGLGLHGDGAPAGHDGPVKREGDLRAPAGAFAITAAYGYGPAAPAGATLPYATVDEAWRCVDDPDSTHYNRVFDSTGVATDWDSAEDMRRADDLYQWVIEIAHNLPGPGGGAAPARPTPGRGSCIFFHVWGAPDDPTVGCTAMSRPSIEALLARLDPARHPVYVLLPVAERAALAAAWRLPR